jgi:hypothetical protein
LGGNAFVDEPPKVVVVPDKAHLARLVRRTKVFFVEQNGFFQKSAARRDCADGKCVRSTVAAETEKIALNDMSMSSENRSMSFLLLLAGAIFVFALASDMPLLKVKCAPHPSRASKIVVLYAE